MTSTAGALTLDMSLFQEWLYQQVGKTIRTVPAVRIDSVKTAEQHAAGKHLSRHRRSAPQRTGPL